MKFLVFLLLPLCGIPTYIDILPSLSTMSKMSPRLFALYIDPLGPLSYRRS